jgi:hypothetical protein
MDDAFRSLSTVLESLVAFRGGFVDEDAGVRTYATGYEIETSVELDVTRDSDGKLRIGTTPPLYPLMTTVSPVYHRLRFVAKLTADERDG